jgi:hypothetical protein
MANATSNATELVRKAEQRLWGEESSALFISSDAVRPDRKIRRPMVIYRKGTDYSFCYVLKDSGTVPELSLLKRKKEVWDYAPRVDKVIRIPASLHHEKMLGTDYTYDDVLQISSLTEDYSHKIVGLSKAMSKKHGKVFVVDFLPLPQSSGVYKKLRAWIREEGSVLLRMQYYDANLKVTRVLQLSDMRLMDGRDIPTRWTMLDLTKKGYYTDWRITKAQFNHLKNDSIFDEKSLRAAPSLLSSKAVSAGGVPNSTSNVKSDDSLKSAYSVMGWRKDFNGEKLLNRYELAVIILGIYREFGTELNITNSLIKYEDAEPRSDSFWAVQVALQTGVLKTFDNRFGGEKALNRYQMAVVLSKILDKLNIDNKSNSEIKFDDVANNHWASSAVKKVVGNGIMIGRENKFYGSKLVTRDQALMIVSRLLQKRV